METINNPEIAKLIIQGFLIGLQCALMLMFIIVTIIDLKNTKKEWHTTKDWISQTENQLKFERQLIDIMTEQDSRLSKVEEKLNIKEDENEQTDSKQKM